MSLIHNDKLPQETAQELPILDIAASALATAFPQIADTSRVGRL